MIEYVSDALVAALFPPDAGGPGLLRIAGPVQVDATIEASGIDFDGTRHLVFFADVMTYAGHDEQFVRETAATWNAGWGALDLRAAFRLGAPTCGAPMPCGPV